MSAAAPLRTTLPFILIDPFPPALAVAMAIFLPLTSVSFFASAFGVNTTLPAFCLAAFTVFGIVQINLLVFYFQ